MKKQAESFLEMVENVRQSLTNQIVLKARYSHIDRLEERLLAHKVEQKHMDGDFRGVAKYVRLYTIDYGAYRIPREVLKVLRAGMRGGRLDLRSDVFYIAYWNTDEGCWKGWPIGTTFFQTLKVMVGDPRQDMAASAGK